MSGHPFTSTSLEETLNLLGVWSSHQIHKVDRPTGWDQVYVCAEVTDNAAVRAAVAEAAPRLGGMDVLVNKAGIGARGSGERQHLLGRGKCGGRPARAPSCRRR
ncbi:MAG: hypothetical protein ACRDQA_25815 [Nocardioidaceae bacterium]